MATTAIIAEIAPFLLPETKTAVKKLTADAGFLVNVGKPCVVVHLVTYPWLSLNLVCRIAEKRAFGFKLA